MTPLRRVLLARPHAFIVNEMRPFLVTAGFAPVRIDGMEQLDQELRLPAQGAIISTAVTSPLGADAATVFRKIRESNASLPVVFAGMADLATMEAVVMRTVKELHPDARAVGPAGFRLVRPLDRASTFLILRKEDLQPGAMQEAAISAIRAQFS
jgi:hypothetical protein